MEKDRFRFNGLALIFFATYLLSACFPEQLWGIHWLAFMPFGMKMSLMLTSFLLIVCTWKPVSLLSSRIPFRLSNSAKLLWIPLAAAGLGGIIFYSFPLLVDPYGDARFIVGQLDGKINSWTLKLLENVLHTDFLNPKIGGDTVSSLALLLAFFTAKTAGETLILLNTGCGMVFLFLWFRLTSHVVEHDHAKIAAWMMGLSAPFLLMFAGHYEYYAPVYVCLLTTLYALIRLEQTQQEKYVGWLCVALCLSIKFHITSYLLVLPVGLKLWYFYRKELIDFLSWENLLKLVVIPLCVTGLLLYFFVLESYDGPRSFSRNTLEDALLLPLYTRESVLLNQYNLFSWNHILDYINLVCWWSPVAIMLVVWALVGAGKQINWEAGSLKIVSFCAILYMGAFFVLNPLLSMPIDWDLFSIPGISFLVAALLVLGQIRDTQLLKRLMLASIAIGILSSSVWWVHTHAESMSSRMETVGKHSYKTYWLGASSSIYAAVDLIEDEGLRHEKLLRIIEELKHFAVLGEDVEYADLLCQAGIYYFQKDIQDGRALHYFKEALKYRPNLSRNVYYLLVTHFMRGEYREAHAYSRLLIGVRYPNYQKAFKISIHTAVEAEAYGDAQGFCEDYLEKWPEDEFITKIHQKLKQPEDRESIKLLFKKGN